MASRLIRLLLLAGGWYLVYRGNGLLGCLALVGFAVLQWARYLRPKPTPAPTPTQPSPAARELRPRPEAPKPASAGTASAGTASEAWRLLPASAHADSPGPLGEEPEQDRSSDRPARWRRLVWSSYGNAFLQDHAPLDSWYCHRQLWDATTPFRDAETGRLLAGDGFEWLRWQKALGAKRLSLERAEGQPTRPGLSIDDRQALVSHFDDRREVWLMAEEASAAAAWEEEHARWSGRHHGTYAPSLDAYWLVAILPAAEPLPAVDWRKVHGQVLHALRQSRHPFQPPETGLPPQDGLLRIGFREEAHPWADFPTLPDDPALLAPHHLLMGLRGLRHIFTNDTHPKNDNSPYLYVSDAEARAVEHHGRVLEQLLGHVQCLAGSETRWRPRLQAEDA